MRTRNPSRWTIPARTGALLLLGIGVLTAAELDAQLAPDAFRGLGDLPGGENASFARDISADGTTVVGEGTNSDEIRQAFRWTAAGGMTSLGALPGGFGGSGALGVSADGSVVVGFSSNGGEMGEAFRWTLPTGMVGLGAPAGAEGSVANAVSGDGAVVVGAYYVNFEPRAFRWTALGGFVAVNNFAGQDALSTAHAVTPDGVIVGGDGGTPATYPASQAMLWMDHTGAELGTLSPSATNSVVLGLSADGAVAVGWSQSDNGLEGFRWTVDDGMSSLGALPGGFFFVVANAVSDDGDMIVGRAATEEGARAFLWTPESGMVALAQFLTESGVNLGDWILEEATGISADGLVIVGNGINPAGEPEAWLVNLRPVPGDGDNEPGGGDDDDDDNDPCRPKGWHQHHKCGAWHAWCGKVGKFVHKWGHKPVRRVLERDWRDAVKRFFAAVENAKRRRLVVVKREPNLKKRW